MTFHIRSQSQFCTNRYKVRTKKCEMGFTVLLIVYQENKTQFSMEEMTLILGTDYRSWTNRSKCAKKPNNNH